MGPCPTHSSTPLKLAGMCDALDTQTHSHFPDLQVTPSLEWGKARWPVDRTAAWSEMGRSPLHYITPTARRLGNVRRGTELFFRRVQNEYCRPSAYPLLPQLRESLQRPLVPEHGTRLGRTQGAAGREMEQGSEGEEGNVRWKTGRMKEAGENRSLSQRELGVRCARCMSLYLPTAA